MFYLSLSIALGGSEVDNAVLIILIGLSNCFGRVINGFLQDRVNYMRNHTNFHLYIVQKRRRGIEVAWLCTHLSPPTFFLEERPSLFTTVSSRLCLCLFIHIGREVWLHAAPPLSDSLVSYGHRAGRACSQRSIHRIYFPYSFVRGCLFHRFRLWEYLVPDWAGHFRYCREEELWQDICHSLDGLHGQHLPFQSGLVSPDTNPIQIYLSLSHNQHFICSHMHT